jgi:hypothetical protein
MAAFEFKQTLRQRGRGVDPLWEAKQPTPRQLAQLSDLGFGMDFATRGAASNALREHYARRQRQRAVGFDTDPRYIDYGGEIMPPFSELMED